MLEKLDKIIRKTLILASIVFVIEIVWCLVDFRSFPLWLALGLAGYGIIVTIYYVIKKSLMNS